MVNYKKILGQTSAYSPNKRTGDYNFPVYRVVKTVSVPADHIQGTQATVSEVTTQIRGEMFPFVAKDWGGSVTEELAEFTLSTNTELTYDESDDTVNDEILYNDARYRIVKMMEHDRIAFDDWYMYALVRKSSQKGGIG